MVEFSNKWYRETCIKNNLNPDNELSKTAVNSARNVAIDLKKYMDANKSYDDTKLHEKLDKEIERLDNVRVGYMLDALFYAEVMAGLGDGYNTFIKRYFEKRQQVMGGVQVSSTDMTDIEKRVSERWEQATQNMKG